MLSKITAIFIVLFLASVAINAEMLDSSGEWKLVLRDGAVGAISNENGITTVTKMNSQGSCELLYTKRFTLMPGSLYVFSADYHVEDARVNTLMLMRVTPGENDLLSFNAVTQTHADWTSQSIVRNSKPNQWDRRVTTYRANTLKVACVRVAIFGNPCKVSLKNFALENSLRTARFLPYKEYEVPFTEEQAKAVLDKRTPVTAEMDTYNGRISMFINNKPIVPVIYKGLGGDVRGSDYVGFAKQNINLVIRGVGSLDRWKFCTNGSIWLGPDKYDFKPLDNMIMEVLKKNPNAELIVDLQVDPYKDWGKEHMDQVVKDGDGKYCYGPTLSTRPSTDNLDEVNAPDSKKFWIPSWQSDIYLNDVAKCFEAIAKHLSTSPLGKAVAGFFITGGDDAQFKVSFYDHSDASMIAFRNYLKQKYGTIEKLNSVWKTSYKSFEDTKVAPETYDLNRTHCAVSSLSDFNIFKWRRTWVFRDKLGEALKKNMGKPVITLTYCTPYHHAFNDTKYIDGVGMQPDYMSRLPGQPLSYYPVADSALGKKMAFTEIDFRSMTGEGWVTDELYEKWASVPRTLDDWKMTHWKGAGISIAAGYADWYYDMGQYFNDDGVHADIGWVTKVHEKVVNTKPVGFKPEVCIVSAEEDPYFYYNGNLPQSDIMNPQLMEFAISGVPFERHFINDILTRPELQKFKVYVFFHNVFISEENRAKIDKLLKKNGKTLVWLYNSGYIAENGMSADNISKLTGIDVRAGDDPVNLTLNLLPDKTLTKGAPVFTGGSQVICRIWGYRGIQEFYITDDNATPLAIFTETGRTAMAVKDMKDWKSIYVAAGGGLSGFVLNNISKDAGAFIGGTPGNQLNMSGEFASIHMLKTGDYTITLPKGRTKVIDAVSGMVVSSGSQTYTFDGEVQKTYWFLFE